MACLQTCLRAAAHIAGKLYSSNTVQTWLVKKTLPYELNIKFVAEKLLKLDYLIPVIIWIQISTFE